MALDYPVRYCSKCGEIEILRPELVPVCEYCGTQLKETEYIFEDVVERGDVKPEIRKAIFEKYIKDNPLYSEEAVKDREEKESRERLNLPSSYKTQQQNIPKCPTCGGTNVHPISAGKKAVGFLTVGVFSKNFGKSYECLQCKYKW